MHEKSCGTRLSVVPVASLIARKSGFIGVPLVVATPPIGPSE